MTKANYTIDTRDRLVLLEDLGTGMSITNDAARVVAQLAEWGSLEGGRLILYRDSEGVWDELRHEGGRFVGFGSIGARTREDAIAVVERGLREDALRRDYADLGVTVGYLGNVEPWGDNRSWYVFATALRTEGGSEKYPLIGPDFDDAKVRAWLDRLRMRLEAERPQAVGGPGDGEERGRRAHTQGRRGLGL